MDDFTRKIKSYIEQNQLTAPGDTVIIGLSGGADSVCLLRVLNELKDELGIKLAAVHVHHGIRGEEADGDESFVRDLCENLSVELTVCRRNIPLLSKESGESEEECGRRIRYEIFGEIAEKYDNAVIATAHHMNDQVETILFRMARGTGIKGIVGMKPGSGVLIRPLLKTGKSEITAYLDLIGQSFRSDATNEETKYSRNYIRKELIPDFEHVNSESLLHIAELAKDAGELVSYMEEEAERVLDEAYDEKMSSATGRQCYSSEVILSKKQVLIWYSLRNMIEKAGVPLKDVSRDHFEKMRELMKKSAASHIFLPKGCRVMIENGTVSVSKAADIRKETDYSMLLRPGEECLIADGRRLVSELSNDFCYEKDGPAIPRNAYTKWLDYDRITDGLCIRYRHKGDYIVVGSKGERKKLKDYMINEKIPKSMRDSIPLLAEGSRILWVIGYRISEDVKITETTTKVLKLDIIEEGE